MLCVSLLALMNYFLSISYSVQQDQALTAHARHLFAAAAGSRHLGVPVLVNSLVDQQISRTPHACRTRGTHAHTQCRVSGPLLAPPQLLAAEWSQQKRGALCSILLPPLFEESFACFHIRGAGVCCRTAHFSLLLLARHKFTMHFALLLFCSLLLLAAPAH